MSVRPRSLPFGWYPTSADACENEIEEFLSGFIPPPGPWIGGVAPHAGWFFSGKAATRVMATLAGSRKPDRIVIFGGHLPAGNRPIIYPDSAWETPFGHLAMDPGLSAELVNRGAAVEASRRFADNTVEIQLPLVKLFFPDSPLVAIHAPGSPDAVVLAEQVVDLLAERGLSAIFVGSADLTHYGPNYGFSPAGVGPAAVQWVSHENDKSLVDKAIAMDVDGLVQDAAKRRNTCSSGAIAAVMATALRKGVKRGTLLEYYTSYDIRPDDSFVGYAAIVY